MAQETEYVITINHNNDPADPEVSTIYAVGTSSQNAVASIFEPDALTGEVRDWSPIYSLSVEVSNGNPDDEHR